MERIVVIFTFQAIRLSSTLTQTIATTPRLGNTLTLAEGNTSMQLTVISVLWESPTQANTLIRPNSLTLPLLPLMTIKVTILCSSFIDSYHLFFFFFLVKDTRIGGFLVEVLNQTRFSTMHCGGLMFQTRLGVGLEAMTLPKRRWDIPLQAILFLVDDVFPSCFGTVPKTNLYSLGDKLSI